VWPEKKLVAAALELGAEYVTGWSREEENLCRRAPAITADEVEKLRLQGNELMEQ